ncbi:MAG: hypothetical protein LBJ97_02955 [Mycoplasmataceae bacterium]|jgi:hypothetical protein|nr:hypothetical protein [Mycoplasmataceae bacterium]
MATKKTKQNNSVESYLKSIRDELFILNKTLIRYTDFKMQMMKKCCNKK